MIWIVFGANDRHLGEVDAPDMDVARARAWAKWGVSVERVQSKASAEIERRERQIPLARRTRDEDDE